METPRIEAYLPTDLQCIYWSQNMIYWAGRLWTLCSLSLLTLINQVTVAIVGHFTSSTDPSLNPSPHTPLNKRKFKKEDRAEDNTNDEDLDLSFLYGFDELSNSKSSPLVPKALSPSPKASKKHGDEIIDVTPLPNELPKQVEGTIEEILKDPDQKEELKSETKKEIEEEKGANSEQTSQPPRFTRFKRIRKKKSELGDEPKPKTSTTDGTPSPATQPVEIAPGKPVTLPANPKPKPVQKTEPVPTRPTVTPIYYDNAGKGNCQLLSILKGLEMQYPELLKDHRKGQTGNLTAQKLRQMGVDFLREQIDTFGEYAEDILGYLDSDRREFNRAQVYPVERSMQRDRAKIERSFKSHKNEKLYEKQKKTHFEKYNKLINNLEKNVVITTDEEFLTRLEKDGFQCSTLHLYALSILLNVPIYVKEQKGVKGHDLQMFNPTDSAEEPIHLYRVADRHYQYMFYPKISSPSQNKK
jgi:hypothetical protein